jgi:hypothetical protein
MLYCNITSELPPLLLRQDLFEETIAYRSS